jgi:hypothetical protein
MITLENYPIPNPDVVGRTVDNEAVLVLPGQGQVKVLNEVGARIWALADGSRSVRDIAAVICSEYEVDSAKAEADTLIFVDDLASRGIVSLKPRQGEADGAG